jgi:hypothetical protein
MTTTTQIQALAYLLHAVRPDWDQTATANHLLPYRHMPYPELILAATAAAADHANRTPASLKWMKTQPKQQVESDVPTGTSKEPMCYICGRSRSDCQKLHDFEVRHGLPDPHIFETHEEADANRSDYQIKDPDADRELVPIGAALDKVAEQTPERAAAKARARQAVEDARQKSKWKPAPPADDRRVQQPEQQETPA